MFKQKISPRLIKIGFIFLALLFLTSAAALAIQDGVCPSGCGSICEDCGECSCPDCPDCQDCGGCDQTPCECGGCPSFCLGDLNEYEIDGRLVCRNPACWEETDCDCSGETPTPTSTLTPTPTPTTPPSNGGDGGDGGDNGGTGGPGEPFVCGATIPSAPTLLSAIKSGSSADLSWTAVEPATHYQISYGFSSGSYLYGVDNTGKVTAYSVGGLDLGSDYCFIVRAVNDCAPSDPSNEICTGQVLGRGQVLGATTLADTGSLAENLFYLLFIMGSVCTGVGLRLLPVKRSA